MKILMLTPYLPYPPASGGQIRTYNLLKYLSKTHEVHLVCLYKKEEEKQHAHQLEQYCKKIHLCKRPEKPWQPGRMLKSILGVLPFLIVRNYSEEARHVVEELLKTEQFDVIHAETFYVMPHIPKTKVPILLVEQTVEYRVYKHFISSKPWFIHHPLRLDTYKLKIWERYYWKRASIVVAVSEADAKTITYLEPSVKPIVIPNGAGDEMFEQKSLYERTQFNDRLEMLFVGNFSWLQNSEASDFIIDKVLPRLAESPLRYRLILAGQNIPSRYLALSDEHIQVIDLDRCEKDMVPQLYATSNAFIAPIFGPGGTRLKILAAMASQLPIVTSSIGAEGLYLTDGVSYLKAEDPDSFVQQIKRLVADPSLQQSLAHHAHQIAVDRFSWRSITTQLIEAYTKLTHA